MRIFLWGIITLKWRKHNLLENKSLLSSQAINLKSNFFLK